MTSLSTISNYIPSIRFPSTQQACKNVTKLALPIVTLVGASMIHAAEAIPYVECIDNCNAHRDIHPLARLICQALCAIFSDDWGDTMSRDFLVSIQGMGLVLLFRIFLSSVLICLAIHTFNFKKLIPFFSWKRVFSVFSLLLAVRIFYGALHFFR